MTIDHASAERVFATWCAKERRRFMAIAQLYVVTATKENPIDPAYMELFEVFLRWHNRLTFAAVARGDFDAEATDEELRLLAVVSAYLGKIEGQAFDGAQVPNGATLATADALGTLVRGNVDSEDPAAAGAQWRTRLRKRGPATDFAAQLLALLPSGKGRPKSNW